MKLIKEIRDKSGELHFKRWLLFKTPFFEVYVHGIYKEDQDECLHNHPWNIWTMVLWGSYIEEVKGDIFPRIYNYRSFLNTGYHNSEEFHCIHEVTSKRVFTLAIVGRRKKGLWGYDTKDGFVDHITFRKNKNG